MASSLNSSTVWFGCSTGLGQAIANHVHNAGNRIVATARNIHSLNYLPDGPNVLKLSLDVTSDDSVASAIDATVKQFGRIDVVVNNAGYATMGEFEGFPEEIARKQLETNFWGAVKVTRASLRVFREVNAPGQGGTIVQVSSIGGSLAIEGNSFYHASKFALEGFTKSVAKEVNPKWNIKFLILSPGAIKTSFKNNIQFLPRHPAYADDPESPFNQFIEYVSKPESQNTWAIPEVCAAVLFDTVNGQNDRALPIRLNLGAEALPLMRADLNNCLKEMDQWEKETLKVASTKDNAVMQDVSRT